MNLLGYRTTTTHECPSDVFAAVGNSLNGASDLGLFHVNSGGFFRFVSSSSLSQDASLLALAYDTRTAAIWGVTSGGQNDGSIAKWSDTEIEYFNDGLFVNDFTAADVFATGYPDSNVPSYLVVGDSLSGAIEKIEITDDPASFYTESIRIDRSLYNYQGGRDFAFHPNSRNPSDAKLYTVTDENVLIRYEINLMDSTSTFKALGVLTFSDGTTLPTNGFESVIFDSDGYMYGYRDGYGYRVDLKDETSNGPFYAEYWTKSKPSTYMKMAKCSFSAIDNYATYGGSTQMKGTTLEENGARHSIGDYNINDVPPKLSDDAALTFSNVFPVMVPGKTIMEDVSYFTEDAGYLTVMADWNGDAEFELSEVLLMNQAVEGSGSYIINIPVPDDAQIGETWLRIRLSEYPIIEEAPWMYGGGKGAIQDHLITVSSTYNYTEPEFSAPDQPMTTAGVREVDDFVETIRTCLTTSVTSDECVEGLIVQLEKIIKHLKSFLGQD